MREWLLRRPAVRGCSHRPGSRPRAWAMPRRASARSASSRPTPAPGEGVHARPTCRRTKPPAEDEAAAGRDRGGQPPKSRGQAATRKPIPRCAELERERQERKLQEAEWRVRFANAREQLALAEAACWHEVVRTRVLPGHPGPDEGEGVRRERGVPAGEAGPRRPRGAVPPHGPASRLDAVALARSISRGESRRPASV